jgi:hypothetical protein
MSPLSWVLPPVNAGFVAGAALGTAIALSRRERPLVGLLVAVSAAWAAGSLYRSIQ